MPWHPSTVASSSSAASATSLPSLPRPRPLSRLPPSPNRLSPRRLSPLPHRRRRNPFDDASAVVVVQSTGVFLVSESHTKRLLPLASELTEAMEQGEPYPVRIDMCHAAVSPDGRLIACGEQDGRHRIFNAQGELIDSIGPHGEYPHHAAFFADGQHVALNACHFYNGGTIAVDVNALGSIDTDFYEEHPAVQVIDSSARVYASGPVGEGCPWS